MQELEANQIAVVPWDTMDSMIGEAVAEYRQINSGIHISLLGTNRGGKTTLVTGGGDSNRGILRHFEDVLVLDTTADPGAISQYGKPVSKYGAIRGHRRLTVDNMTVDTKRKIHAYIQKAHKQGNVAIYADEIRQLADKKYFGLGPTLDFLWLFGAKKGCSLIGGTQAPLFVPGAFYDQAKLHFLFHIRDERRMKRLSEIGGDTATLKAILPRLQRWEFAYVDLMGDVTVSKFELKQQSQNRAQEIQQEKRLRIQRGTAHGLTPVG